MEELRLVLDVIVIPLFVWIWFTDRKLVKIEATQIKTDDLEKIYNKLEEIRESNSNMYVTKDTCNQTSCLNKC